MRSSYFFIFTLYQCIVMQYTSDTRVSNGYDFHACMKGHIHLKPAKYEEVVIYAVNLRIPNICRSRKMQSIGVIRKYLTLRGEIL